MPDGRKGGREEGKEGGREEEGVETERKRWGSKEHVIELFLLRLAIYIYVYIRYCIKLSR